MLGKIEGRKRKGKQRMRWLDGWHHSLNGHKFEQAQGDVRDGKAWLLLSVRLQRVGHDSG